MLVHLAVIEDNIYEMNCQLHRKTPLSPRLTEVVHIYPYHLSDPCLFRMLYAQTFRSHDGVRLSIIQTSKTFFISLNKGPSLY